MAIIEGNERGDKADAYNADKKPHRTIRFYLVYSRDYPKRNSSAEKRNSFNDFKRAHVYTPWVCFSIEKK